MEAWLGFLTFRRPESSSGVASIVSGNGFDSDRQSKPSTNNPVVATQGLALRHSVLHAVAGMTALYEDCPLERSVRGLQAMERHIAAQPVWAEDAGGVFWNMSRSIHCL